MSVQPAENVVPVPETVAEVPAAESKSGGTETAATEAQKESAASNGTAAAKVVDEVKSSGTPAGAAAPVEKGGEKESEQATTAAAPVVESAANNKDKPKKQDEEAKPAESKSNPEDKSTASEAENEKNKKPDYLANNSGLSQFFDRLSAILSKTGHGEMWGVFLEENYSHAPTINVLIKFLRANEGSVKLAEEQLTKALEWRKEMKPLSLLENGSFNADKFGGLGYVSKYKEGESKDAIVNWNIYGAVKDFDATFGDSEEFVKWRVALMEFAVKDLKLAESTSVLDYDGEDPYQMIQVHDYQNVSFLRMNPKARAASKKTIEVFSMAYPELLREKYFVNVPAIMGWMFTAMKVFLSKNTTRKFHPITNGANLAREFPVSGSDLPKEYGGKGPDLKENAQTVRLEAPAKESKPEPEASKSKPEESKSEPEASKSEPKASKNEPTQTESKIEEAGDKPTKTEPAAPAPEASPTAPNSQ